MTTLDDFFGDGSTDNRPVCSYCGSADESKLIVSIQDHNGPTHWHHESCKAKDDASKGTPLTPTWDETMEINFRYVYVVPWPKLAEVVRLANCDIKMSGQDVESFCTADGQERQEHQQWLNTASTREIADWVIAGNR